MSHPETHAIYALISEAEVEDIDIAESCTAHVDGELAGSREAEMSRMAKDDPVVREIVATERAVRQAVGGKIERVVTPAYLRMRVLDSMAENPGVLARLVRWIGEFRLGPVPSLVLVSLAAVALFTAFVSHDTAFADSSELVNLSGTVVCVDCAVAHNHGTESACTRYGHRNGVRDGNGRLWTFLSTEKWQEYYRNTEYHGRQITVRGHVYPEAGYLDLVSLQFDTMTGAQRPRVEQRAPVMLAGVGR
jgi:hypothetical protein